VKQRPGLEASQARDLPARDRRGCPNGTIPAMELIFVEKLSHALSATAILLTLRRNARALGSLLRSYRARPSLPPSTSSSSSSLHLSPSPPALPSPNDASDARARLLLAQRRYHWKKDAIDIRPSAGAISAATVPGENRKETKGNDERRPPPNSPGRGEGSRPLAVTRKTAPIRRDNDKVH